MEEDTFRLLTARDQSSISIPRWLLWCFLSCLPERPQNAGDWPDYGDDKRRVESGEQTDTHVQKVSWWMCD